MKYLYGEKPAIGDLIALVENRLGKIGTAKFSARPPAKAVVLNIIKKGKTLKKRMVTIKWVDGYSRRQADGGYSPERFKLVERYDPIGKPAPQKNLEKIPEMGF